MGRVVEGDCATAANRAARASRACASISRTAAIRSRTTKANITSRTSRRASHVVQVDAVTIPETHHAADLRGSRAARGPRVLAVRRRARRRAVAQPTSCSSASAAEGFVALAFRRLENPLAPDAWATAAPALNQRRSRACRSRNLRVLVMLPDGLAYRDGQRAVSMAPRSPAPANAERRADFRAQAHAADAPPTLSFRTAARVRDRAARSASRRRRCSIRRRKPRSDGAGRERRCCAARCSMRALRTASAPRFDVLAAEIQPSDRSQLDKIVNEWRGVTHLRLSGDRARRSDRDRRAHSNRRTPDNYACRAHARKPSRSISSSDSRSIRLA